LPVFKESFPVTLSATANTNNTPTLLPTQSDRPAQAFDVVFPVMHGTFGEDGTIQGLLELANVPYVGCGVLSSAVAMDKDVAKKLLREAGLPVTPGITVRAFEWRAGEQAITARVASELGFPCFTKPANLGSSVGIHKVRDARHLRAAVTDAFRYDEKIVIEKGLNTREIETAVLEAPTWGDAPLVSIPSEIIPRHEFYSYEAKYLDENGASLVIPAELSAAQVEEAQALAQRAFLALECEGMARVDFFLEKPTGKFYVNEANTIPGFTSISMYPKMWEASGVSYAELLTRLVELAITRHDRRAKLVRDFSTKL
jgi:D-alanine-D-alanine ligase